MNPDGNTTNPQPDYPHAGYSNGARPPTVSPNWAQMPYGLTGYLPQPFDDGLLVWLNYYLNGAIPDDELFHRLKDDQSTLEPSAMRSFVELRDQRAVWLNASSDPRVNPLLLRALLRSNFEPFKLPASNGKSRKQIAESIDALGQNHPQLASEYSSELADARESADDKAKRATTIIIVVYVMIGVLPILYLLIAIYG